MAIKTKEEIQDTIDDLKKSEDGHVQAAIDALYWVLD